MVRSTGKGKKGNVEPALLKVNLGCGKHPNPMVNGVQQVGFIGVDIADLPGVIRHDLEKYPWPFKDNSVDEIICSHFLEHVREPMPFFNELFRVMKVGAKALIVVPYGLSVRAWQDPTHCHAYTEHSFLYYNAGWRKANDLEHYQISCDFDFSYGYVFNQGCAFAPQTKNEQAVQFAIQHYMNVVNDLVVTMTKRGEEQK